MLFFITYYFTVISAVGTNGERFLNFSTFRKQTLFNGCFLKPVFDDPVVATEHKEDALPESSEKIREEGRLTKEPSGSDKKTSSFILHVWRQYFNMMSFYKTHKHAKVVFGYSSTMHDI